MHHTEIHKTASSEVKRVNVIETFQYNTQLYIYK